MLQTSEQYDFVKDLLVTRMSNYRRNSFKLQRLYEIISTQARDKAYIQFSYKEFYDMFVKECVNGNIPNHTFKILNEGFYDNFGRVPYADIHVDFVYVPKRKHRTKSVTENTKTC